MSFTEQEIAEFKTEALELLEMAEKSLLALDGGADFQAGFDAVFRGFHNLKGAAGMMELQQLQAHTHELENIWMSLKSGSSVSKEHISLFLRGIDAARSILDGKEVQFSFELGSSGTAPKQTSTTPVIEQAPPAEPTTKSQSATEEAPAAAEFPEALVNEFVSEGEEIVERVSKNLQALEAGNPPRESVDALYRDVHSLKGSAYLFNFGLLGDLAHAMETSLEGVRKGTHIPTTELLNLLFTCVENIEVLIERIKSKKSFEDLAAAVRTRIKTLNSVGQSAPSEASPVATVASSAAPPAQANTAGEISSIRVPVPLLDNLMTLMGEMVLVRNQVLQFSNRSDDLELLSMSKRLNVVTSEIQTEMMKTRMQPIGNVLSKFTRVVRDLSQGLKKQIHLNLSGSETELDKSLLEAIKDPLTHIVRNSCDHGIEAPEIRRQNGKPEAGTIHIKAYHEGGQVVIEVSDDGKGLNKEVLVRKAIEKGIVTEIQAAKFSEKEIFNLIFAPGFSTAAQVTNVSGRGVGMDVVRTNIERIGGAVDLSSVAGAGTSIKIKIPLTLAIVPALIVKCGEGIFAIPQVKLEELVRVDQSSADNKIEILHGAPVYRLRGDILPLVDLNKVLGIQNPTGDQEKTIFNIAVLNAETCSFGVIIDEVRDTADIVVKPLNRLLKSLQVYSGATILGDGSVALIFDVLGISKVAQINSENVGNADAEQRQNGRSNQTEIQDFLLVRLNSPTKHALALSYVNRLEEFQAKDVEYSGHQRMIRYRDMILPLVSANEQLGYTAPAEKKESIPVIVIQRAGMLFGLEVDEIIDTLSTEANTNSSLNKHPGIFGNLNTKDELIVVVNPFELISQAYPAIQEPPPTNLVVKNGGKKILLAEDTVFFRKAIKNVLEQGGFEVVTAVDGQEALDILSRPGHSFDLLVSDIEMPKVNGFQLASAVRQNPGLTKMPMLAISSRADQSFIAEGTRVGFDIYLEKLKPTLLLDAVNKLIHAKRSAA